MTDTIINLISDIKEKDDDGVMRNKTTVSRPVYARCGSVTRSEFAAAGRNGLNPDIYFTVFHADYNGELTLEYNGRGYGIYRTYHVPGTDYLELYCERKGGTNGGS